MLFKCTHVINRQDFKTTTNYQLKQKHKRAFKNQNTSMKIDRKKERKKENEEGPSSVSF